VAAKTLRASRPDHEREASGHGNLGRPLENYLRPAVQAADRVDYLIRRNVVSFVEASEPIVRRRSKLNVSPHSAWFLAIGRCLKLQYDEALAAPLPPRLAALITELETQNVRG
jgi:hypothetical protein